MNKIEQIKAEIEKRIANCETQHPPLMGGRDFTDRENEVYCEECAYRNILEYINSLPAKYLCEPSDGLEKEIKRFLSNATKMNKGEWREEYHISEIGFRAVARHFYELGLNAIKEGEK